MMRLRALGSWLLGTALFFHLAGCDGQVESQQRGHRRDEGRSVY
jgi:hypothetical protein